MICGTKCMTDLPIILQRTILQHRFHSLGSHIGKSRLYLSDWSLAMRRGKKCMADHPIISHKIILQFMADYQNSFYVCLRVVQLTLSTQMPRYGFIEIGIGAAVP